MPDKQSETATAAKLYSVPRRYDLATLFTVSLAYAMFFGLMRLTTAPPMVVALIASFVTVVGLAQALVLKGKSPRLASILAGILFWLTVGLATVLWSRSVASVIEVCIMALCSGVPMGYLAGVVVGGVFLVADLVRKAIRRLRKGRGSGDVSESEPKDDSPFV